MRAKPDCIPCFLRQALTTARMVTDDEAVHERVLCEVMRRMADKVDLSLSPAVLSTEAARIAAQSLGVYDPYAEVRRRFNEMCLDMYPRLKGMVERSPDPLHTAIKLAAAGNVIDLGAGDPSKLEEDIRRVIEDGFAVDHYPDFKSELEGAEAILYILDNSGEIVFDRVLMEEILKRGKHRIIAAVKSEPILNDAVREDAEQAGITEIAGLIETGTGYLGAPLEKCSDDFLRAFREADLIISKGQANFETLDEAEGNIFFILKAKCPIVAERLGVRLNDMVFVRR